MLQIVSVFGLVNLAAALVLIYRNHVIAWLTILPVAVMLLPCIAVPLEQILAQASGPDNVITFQRFFFSIPPCLAVVCLWAQLHHRPRGVEPVRLHRPHPSAAPLGPLLSIPADDSPPSRDGFYALVIVSMAFIALTTAPSSSPYYNRAWNTNVVVPDDLRLRDVFSRYEAVKLQLLNSPESKIVATQAGTALLASYTPDLIGQGRSRMIGLPATDSITEALDFLDYNERENSLSPAAPFIEVTQMPFAVNGLNLIGDPMASNPQAWSALGGHSPEFVSGITDFPTTSTALQNPVGAASFVFTSAMIPVQRLKSYRLELSVKQVQSIGATVYLAIAWYDAGGRLLVSNAAQPQGAGNPRGWRNGGYSYFGLVAQTPPTAWATYGNSFGLGEASAIPPNARSVRVGALLNYSYAPLAVVQLSNVRLLEKTTPAIGLAIPNATSAYSHVSQAAQLSIHWPPNQVMADRGGTKEILAAALTVVPVSSK